MIKMKYYNVYYFCHLANTNTGKFLNKTSYFFEGEFCIEPEDFPEVSVLRFYCYWLVDCVIFEQADLISKGDDAYDFHPAYWISNAISKYNNVTISFDAWFDTKSKQMAFSEDFAEVFR